MRPIRTTVFTPRPDAVHYGAADCGAASTACGKLRETLDRDLVSCGRCKRTKAYRGVT